MRPTIRSQILVPVLAVQVAALASLAAIAAASAARRVESDVVARLDAVAATLQRSSFPLTPAVLEAMRGLSGAEFVAVGADGSIRGSTLRDLAALPGSLRSLPDRPRAEPPGRSPSVEVLGRRYFAASVRSGGDRPAILVLYPEDAWVLARREAALPPILVGLVAIAATAAATGWVAHRLGRRLRTLREKTAAIAAGDLRPISTGRAGDEVHDLAESINRMSAQLREMHAATRRAERSGVLAQLAAGLAHSLRNAATGARMAVQLHARRCPAADDGRIDVALRQLQIGETHIKSLLALGRPERREPTACEAADLVADVAALVEPACRHARVAFRHEGVRGLPILADAEALRAAVLNLALNAVEAAGPGGSVAIAARRDDGRVRFEVDDSGPGPPADLADSLFEPFVTGKPEGVGLGLAVARQVAADHHGTLSWKRDDGRTRFVLALPVDRGAHP